jgi:hypothetical protein
MNRAEQYRPAVKLPIIDLLLVILLIAASGYVWREVRGKPRVQAELGGLEGIRAGNAQALSEANQGLLQNKADLAGIHGTHAEQVAQIVGLETQMHATGDQIARSRERDHLATDRLLDMRGEIQRGADQRKARQKELEQIETQIGQVQVAVGELGAQLDERHAELVHLGKSIAAAEAQLEADPPSRFPEHSSFASMVELADAEDRVMVSLARRLKDLGRVGVGLLGSLGVSRGAESSIREGGLFANVVLVPRRASVDLEGGISQRIVRDSDEQETGGFAAATLRFAPLRRERLFLLAGTRYGHDDLGMRLGLGFGRR